MHGEALLRNPDILVVEFLMPPAILYFGQFLLGQELALLVDQISDYLPPHLGFAQVHGVELRQTDPDIVLLALLVDFPLYGVAFLVQVQQLLDQLQLDQHGAGLVDTLAERLEEEHSHVALRSQERDGAVDQLHALDQLVVVVRYW